jgi:hypothetical protein
MSAYAVTCRTPPVGQPDLRDHGQSEEESASNGSSTVQAALKLVAEPIFEADFLPCSFGCGGSAHDALAGAH